MKLYEFFGNIKHEERNERDPQAPSKEEEQELCDQVFWYILDDNDLHKKHFMPTAKKLKKLIADKTDDDSHDWKVWLPMVKEGCMKFYEDHDVKDSPTDTFNKEFCMDLCKRLADHYHEDIIKDEYNLGH
jgi:hypothetical protein